MAKTTFKTDIATNIVISLVLCGCQNMLHKLCIVYLAVMFVCLRFWIFVIENKLVRQKKQEYKK